MADNNTIARPYARAAFELARAKDRLGAWSDALNVAGRLLADGEVARFLGSPSLNDDQRLDFLAGLIKSANGEAAVLDGSDPEGRNFLRLLIEYDRVGVLPEIATHFDALKADVENTVDVTVTSAVALSEDQQEQIVRALKQRMGREVRLTTQTDDTLIGGAVIRAGDVVIDGSLRARLEGLGNALVA
ncbi:MAG: F0F1 ATP synthase subunit delta [Woeseiaceae bacterium]|nr:F0F1 ATP synthase subunit delta [Woeseiaceae bacterium]